MELVYTILKGIRTIAMVDYDGKPHFTNEASNRVSLETTRESATVERVKYAGGEADCVVKFRGITI